MSIVHIFNRESLRKFNIPARPCSVIWTVSTNSQRNLTRRHTDPCSRSKDWSLHLLRVGSANSSQTTVFSVALVRVTQDHVPLGGSAMTDRRGGIEPGLFTLACDSPSALLDSKLPMGLWDCTQPNFSLSSSLLLALLLYRWWFPKHSIIMLYMLICNSICFQGTHPITSTW